MFSSSSRPPLLCSYCFLLAAGLLFLAGCQQISGDPATTVEQKTPEGKTNQSIPADPRTGAADKAIPSGDTASSDNTASSGKTDLSVQNGTESPAADRASKPDPAATSPALRSLWQGPELEPWRIARFGGEGAVRVVDGELELAAGEPLTGIRWKGDPLPTENYRIELEAKRTDGLDFFCCLTFPVRDQSCSLVIGGWSGSVVGLSCVDGEDAANNPTTRRTSFDNDRWYRIELEVAGGFIRARIDGEQWVEQAIEGHQFSLRNEVLPTRPLGICTFRSTARLRNLKLHPANDPASAGVDHD